MTRSAVDVVIIGAGVVGTAIARTLAAYSLDIVLADAASDVGTGTSKANTAILHTGFDAKPGSLESRLLSRGCGLLRSYASAARIPLERTGALLVAWTPDQMAALPSIEENARRNGYLAVRPLAAAGLYAREPALGPGALGGLEIPDESIICPWTTPLAFATEAVGAGVRLLLTARVTGVAPAGDGYELATTRGPVRCRWVVNAAGLGSDEVDRMFGGERQTGVILDTLTALTGVAGLALLAGGLAAIPALVRLLRAGRRPKVRRRLVWAVGATVATAAGLAWLTLWSGTSSLTPLSTSPTCIADLKGTTVALAIALCQWASVARRLDLAPRVRAAGIARPRRLLLLCASPPAPPPCARSRGPASWNRYDAH